MPKYAVFSAEILSPALLSFYTASPEVITAPNRLPYMEGRLSPPQESRPRLRGGRAIFPAAGNFRGRGRFRSAWAIFTAVGRGFLRPPWSDSARTKFIVQHTASSLKLSQKIEFPKLRGVAVLATSNKSTVQMRRAGRHGAQPLVLTVLLCLLAGLLCSID